jgi:type IV secretion system protein VirB1
MLTFEALALKCAPAIALDMLVAIAAVESHLDPLAVIDGRTRTSVQSAGHGVATVVGAADQGRSVGIGLIGLSATETQALGVPLADVFDPCINLATAQKLLQQAFAAADKRGLIGARAERFVIRSWWRPDGRFVSDEFYERAVDAERKRADQHAKTQVKGTAAAKPASPPATTEKAPDFRPLAVAGPVPTAREQRPPAPWDVFATARGTGVLIFSQPRKATP